jgi:hypothetical protein
VTRFRANTDCHVTASRPLPRGGILTDDHIVLAGRRSREEYPADLPLRRVRVHVVDREEPLVFLTNQVQWGPTTTTRIYKERSGSRLI